MGGLLADIVEEDADKVDIGIEEVLVLFKFILSAHLDVEDFQLLVEVDDPAEIGLTHILEVVEEELQLTDLILPPSHLLVVSQQIARQLIDRHLDSMGGTGPLAKGTLSSFASAY